MSREKAGAASGAEHQLAHVKEALVHLVERSFLDVLMHSNARELPLKVGEVHLGVTEIRLQIDSCHDAQQPLGLMFAWQQDAGRLSAMIVSTGWMERIPEANRYVVEFALAGLYQYAGAAQPDDGLITWDAWVSFWEKHQSVSGKASATTEPALAGQSQK
jgi:hypothetical protein